MTPAILIRAILSVHSGIASHIELQVIVLMINQDQPILDSTENETLSKKGIARPVMKQDISEI